MKLLLTSGGIINTKIKKAFLSLLPNSPQKLRIAMIQTASNIEDGDKSWLVDDLYRVKNLGFEVFDFVDISALSKEEVFKRLTKADVLFFGGGNPFYLYYWIKKIGLDKKIKGLLKKRVYFGVSAGSMVTNSYIALKPKKTSSSYISKNSKQKGLSLVDFSIKPHFLSPYFPERTAEWMKKFAKNFPSTIYALDDNSSILVDGSKMEVVSSGKWEKFEVRNN